MRNRASYLKLLLTLLLVSVMLHAQAGSVASSDVASNINMAREALSRSNYSAAIARLQATDSGEENWQVLFWLGTAYLLDGQLDNAADVLDEALGVESDRASIWVQRAVVEQEREQFAVALQFLEVAAQIDTQYPLTYVNAATAYESLGDSSRARSAYGQFLKLTARDGGSSRLRRLRRDVLSRIARTDS